MNPQSELVAFASPQVTSTPSSVLLASGGPPPASVDVTEVFIDRGPALPHRAGGPSLCLIVQSETCAHVYWEASVEGPGDWELTAWSADGQVLQRFQTPDGPTGGFLHLPLASIARIEATHPHHPTGLSLHAPARSAASHPPAPTWAGAEGSAAPAISVRGQPRPQARTTASSPARSWSA